MRFIPVAVAVAILLAGCAAPAAPTVTAAPSEAPSSIPTAAATTSPAADGVGISGDAVCAALESGDFGGIVGATITRAGSRTESDISACGLLAEGASGDGAFVGVTATLRRGSESELQQVMAFYADRAVAGIGDFAAVADEGVVMIKGDVIVILSFLYAPDAPPLDSGALIDAFVGFVDRLGVDRTVG